MADETGGARTFGSGPEAQGVQFVLSVQDFGTDILTAADKAFQKLLDVMKQVASATDKFTSGILSKMTQAAQVDKQNGGVAPLITPFTLSQKALDMMPKFAKASLEWVRSSASALGQWSTSMGLAGSRTRDFRDAMAQAQIEGKKFTDQFAGVGKLLAEKLGSAIGKTLGAGATTVAAGVTGGVLKAAELYRTANQIGIMRGWNDKQMTEYTKHLIDLSNATNINVDSLMAQAKALTDNHIPMERQTDDLLVLNATMAKRSQIKGSAGTMSDDAVANATAQMIQVMKLNAQQVAALWNTIDTVSLHSKLVMPEAVGLVQSYTSTFDQLFAAMSPVERAARESHIAPQLLAIAAAAKEANVPLDTLQQIFDGMINMNSDQFTQVASLLGLTGKNLGLIRKEVKDGDWIDAFKSIQDSVAKTTKGFSPEQLQAWSNQFNGAFGKDTMLRLAQIGKIPEVVDNTTKSMGQLNKETSDKLRQAMADPISQFNLMIQKVENFWANVAIKHMPEIVTGLKIVNALLSGAISFFSKHDTIAEFTFWLGAATTAIFALGTAWKTMKLLGWVDVFTVISGAVKGLIGWVRGLQVATMLADAAALPWLVTLTAIAAAIAAIYELWKHKDFVEDWGKKLVGDLPSFIGKRTLDSKDISNSMFGGASNSQPAAQQTASTEDKTTAAEGTDTSTMESLLQGILKVLTDTKDQQGRNNSPLAGVAGWNPQPSSF